MAKKTEVAHKTPSPIPLPRGVLEHHLKNLAPLLREWKRTGRVPPVILLTGTPGVGKRSMTYWLGQWILCERNGFARTEPDAGLFGEPAAPASAQAIEPCEECAACARALHGNWVDFTEVRAEAEGDSEARNLKVDQFRELKLSQGFGAHEGAYRLILIPDADRMTAQASNSVLKLLEEPPRGWLFVLTAADPTLLLPTVLSRCQQYRLKPFTERALEALLIEKGEPQARAALCARLAQGSWGRALKLTDPEAWEERLTLLKLFEDPAASATPLLEWASGSDPSFEALLTQLESLCADLVRWSVSGLSAEQHDWVNTDARAALGAHAKSAVQKLGGIEPARRFWIGRSERLMKARVLAKAPLNRKIVIQDLLLPWLAT